MKITLTWRRFSAITIATILSACLALSSQTRGQTRADQEEDSGLQQLAATYYAEKYRIGHDEARERLAIQDRAAGIEDQLAELLGRQFAGIWYDHADRGRLKIGITRLASARADDVRRIAISYGVADAADLVPVSFTLAELELKQDRIRQDLMETIRSGQARTSYNTKANSVVITAIARLAPADEARVEELSREAGVIVRRIDAATLRGKLNSCIVTKCDPPLRGGREIIGTSGVCTAAFMARHRVNTSHLLVMTAGHCNFFSGGLTGSWSTKNEANTSEQIGNTYGYVFAGSMGKDAGVIRLDPNSYWATPAPLAAVVVKTSINTIYNPTYSIRHDSLSSLGQILCRTGRSTGTSCAEVSDLGEDFCADAPDGNTYLLQNMGELDMCGLQTGDSGGAVYKKHRAYGILVGVSEGPFTCYEVYQGIRGAENALNVDILFAP